MKRYILPLILLAGSANALDLKYGKGDFEWSAGFAGIAEQSVTLDDNIISISEQHLNIGDSPWYIFGNIDIHNSDQLDKITDVADSIRESMPILPIDIIGDIAPFPSSFKISGVDLDIGVGYDIVHNQDGYFGIGVVTGLSTPFMEMNNYLQSYNQLSELLRDTSTDVTTYKLGVSLQAAFTIADSVSIYGTGIYAMQNGDMTNKIVKGTFDVSGTYTSLDLGIRYDFESTADNGNFYIKAGYAYKHWAIDDISGGVAGLVLPIMPSLSDMDMTVDYGYIGIGYNF